jgi:daunorubicin resistance ABC transporter membrane protein
MSAGTAVFSVLVRRDLRLFVTRKSRVFGALAQPLLFWVILGAGLAPSFKVPGSESGPDYFTWFFPGVVMMMLLFTSISATMSVIEDRHQGFLQGVLAAPGPRGAVALGKTAGGAIVGLIHAVLLLALMPLAGFPFGDASWVTALLSLALAATGMTALGFVIAWKLDSTAGYHVVMSLVLMPLWIISGALFPITGTHAVMAFAAKLNPVAYAVTALREGLTGAPLMETLPDLGILAAFVAVALFAAARTARKGGI